MEGVIVPGIDFLQNLRVVWIVVPHQRTVFNTESVPPKCQVSNRGRSVWWVLVRRHQKGGTLGDEPCASGSGI